VDSACKRVFQHEEEADQVTRDVLLAVGRTFITPFDRSDIKDLTTHLDDCIDQMQKTAKAIMLFEVQEFEPQMREMGDIIVRAADLTVEAVPLLRSMNQNQTRLNGLTEEITRIEEQSDRLYDAGVKALFNRHRHGDAMGFIAAPRSTITWRRWSIGSRTWRTE
jgi:predicted phosphate transport protein (TIGR00153 family)